MSAHAPTDSYEGGKGPPLVLLHGIGGSWRIWRPVIPMLERRHRIYAPTLPGHLGGEPWPWDSEATVYGIVDKLAEDFAQRGIDRPHVVGNSLGGWIALELARRNIPASVTALSPAGAWRNDRHYQAVARPFRIAHALMPLLIPLVRPLLGIAAVRRSLNAQAMEHGDRVPRDEMLHAMRSLGGTRILPQLLATMGRKGPIKPLVGIHCPITIAWGEHDKVIPFETYGAPMLAAAPGAVAATLAGCGHVPMYDAPEMVAALILTITTTVRGEPI
jgi:pimeloyl-ACP methyl ester carboxylesterase